MKQISKLLKTSAFVLAGFFGSANILSAQSITENFDDITTLAGNGWSLQNLSTPVGSTNWFQGTNVAAGGPFDSYNGAVNSYIGANYNNTGSTGTISNWLMMPNRTLRNGDVITFYSRKVSPDSYADRLEVRMSTNGASTNAGTNATTLGDFTTLLLSINPSLVLGVYPTVWTQYTITISGLPAPTSGRIAFRYFVTGAGLSGTNSDYIGIDAFTYTPYVCPAFTISPSTIPNGTAGTAYNQSLGQTGSLGTPTFSVTAGALPPGLTLSATGTISGTPTATGTFNFTTTVSDASGCTGSQAYSLNVACPTGGATLSSFPMLCNNATPYTLTEGSPAGGTYSGVGVGGSDFDPANGTQTITYTLIDTYGCIQTASQTMTVNTAPTVTLTSFTPVCDNGGMVTLTGGSPAGGTYTGTNVSAGMFDPSAGTQNLTYTFTDANNCSGSSTQAFLVNTAPTVTLTSFAPVCDNGGMVTLTGGSPAGGTYSGTNVSAGMFDPSAGTQTILYSYTDANSCSNNATQSFTVNAAPSVTLSSFTPVCDNSGMVTLTGGSPAGGTYSGTNVSAGMFDPSAGTQTILYSYTDANSCSNNATQSITVNTAPTVTLSSFNPVCSNGGMVVLGGGSPAGGTYSGTNVGSGMFDPSAGTQTITYSYTDANSCSNSTSQSFPVNTAPTVTATVNPTACTSDSPLTLSGGTPAGGTWSGTGVSGSTFNPTTAGVGTFTLTYSFTDANACTGTATDNIAVSICSGVQSIAAENSNISIFPNPNSGLFSITFNGPAQGKLIVSILSVDGKVISVDQRTDYNGSYEHTFDLSTMPKGIYLVEVQNETGRFFGKIVLQ